MFCLLIVLAVRRATLSPDQKQMTVKITKQSLVRIAKYSIFRLFQLKKKNTAKWKKAKQAFFY